MLGYEKKYLNIFFVKRHKKKKHKKKKSVIINSLQSAKGVFLLYRQWQQNVSTEVT